MLGVGSPFSEKMLQTHYVLHCLGAGRNLKADEPDEADEVDKGKMVHHWQFGP